MAANEARNVKRLKKKGKKKEKKPIVESDEESATVPSSSVDDVHKCLRYSLSSSYSCERHLFLKEDASNSQCLLVGNVPAYIDLEVIKGFMAHLVKYSILGIFPLRSNALGNRMDVGQLTVRVLFDSPDGVKEVLKKAEKAAPMVAENYGIFDDTSVLQMELDSYRKRAIPHDELMKEVDEFMERHDEHTITQQRAARKRKQEPDEDGWITVTKGSRKSVPQAKKVKDGMPPSKKAKKKDSVAFYNFQVKESRLKHVNELRAKFEEDKKRVALAKAARKFNPT